MGAILAFHLRGPGSVQGTICRINGGNWTKVQVSLRVLSVPPPILSYFLSLFLEFVIDLTSQYVAIYYVFIWSCMIDLALILILGERVWC
jgi:hypothetical protein